MIDLFGTVLSFAAGAIGYRLYLWAHGSPPPPAPTPEPERKLLPSPPVSKLIFHRHDGAKTEVTCVRCSRCTNYWFCQNVEIEAPPFCCYCGTKYDGVQYVPNEEIDKHQIL